jgi:hypothetical protein
MYSRLVITEGQLLLSVRQREQKHEVAKLSYEAALTLFENMKIDQYIFLFLGPNSFANYIL